MRKLFLAMGILALSAGVAFAGSNAGIQLHVHGNVAGVETNGDPCGALAVPADCGGLVPSGAPDANGAEWFVVVAVSPPANSPNFNTIIFGVGDYVPLQSCYVALYGPCHADLNPLETSSAGWPGPSTGTAVSWAPNCLTGHVEPVYYFAVYSYGGGAIPLGDFYPGQAAGVVSCDSPPEEDPFASYGAMGCGGDPGSNPECPGAPPEPAACCVGPDCFMLTEDECNAAGGEYQGDGTNCVDIDCGIVTATEQTTWGQIKSTYR